MTSLYSTKRDPTCWRTTSPDSLGPRKTSPAFLHLTHSRRTSTNSRCRMKSCRASRHSGTPTDGLKRFQNKIRLTTRPWSTNSFKIKIRSSGPGWMISTTQEQRYTFPRGTGKKPCARPTTASSEDTTRLTKPTLKSLPPTSGQRWGKISSATRTSAYNASNERNWQTRKLHWHLSRSRLVQTSGFTLTFLAQCSQQTVIKICPLHHGCFH